MPPTPLSPTWPVVGRRPFGYASFVYPTSLGVGKVQCDCRRPREAPYPLQVFSTGLLRDVLGSPSSAPTVSTFASPTPLPLPYFSTPTGPPKPSSLVPGPRTPQSLPSTNTSPTHHTTSLGFFRRFGLTQTSNLVSRSRRAKVLRCVPSWHPNPGQETVDTPPPGR